MQRSAEADGRADALLRRVATLPGVADVRYDRAWLAKVGAGLDSLRRAGLVLALLMAVAAAVTVAAVVRLGLHARREEIEIMQLVGASIAFIRGPFVAEGLLQGGIGAIAAVLLLWGGFAASSASWGPQLTDGARGARPRSSCLRGSARCSWPGAWPSAERAALRPRAMPSERGRTGQRTLSRRGGASPGYCRVDTPMFPWLDWIQSA